MTRAPGRSLDELRAEVARVEDMACRLSPRSDLAVALASRVDRVRRKLDDPRLHVAVVGEFNSGKSTFVNALLADPLLPTAPVIATGCAVQIRHGERLGLTFRPRSGLPVTFPRDGGAAAVDAFWTRLRRLHPAVRRPRSAADAIGLLVADPDMCGAVGWVSIEHPASFLAGGVVLVDTPGIDGMTEQHEAVTHRVLEEVADLVVVVVPAGSPVSRALVEFVTTRLHRHLDRCAVVVTKLDQVEPAFRETVLRSVRRRLDLAGLPDAPVITSAGPDPTARFPAYALADLAARMHARALTTSATHLVADLISTVAPDHRRSRP